MTDELYTPVVFLMLGKNWRSKLEVHEDFIKQSMDKQ